MVDIHGVPVPGWLQQMRPGDPIEVTIRGTLTDVFTDISNGPDHLVIQVGYASRSPARHLHIDLPAEPGVTIRTFTLAQQE